MNSLIKDKMKKNKNKDFKNITSFNQLYGAYFEKPQNGKLNHYQQQKLGFKDNLNDETKKKSTIECMF